jgi:hypothetical protein
VYVLKICRFCLNYCNCALTEQEKVALDEFLTDLSNIILEGCLNVNFVCFFKMTHFADCYGFSQCPLSEAKASILSGSICVGFSYDKYINCTFEFTRL